MFPQIAIDNKLKILINQEVKYTIEIMTMLMGFLVVPCILSSVKQTNQNLEMVCHRSVIFVAHIQGYRSRMDLCSWHNPCC
jgi:hypothetical protein